MNTTSPLNLSFSSIKGISYRRGASTSATPDCQLSERIMKAVVDSPFIQNLARNEDIYLSIAGHARLRPFVYASHDVTLDIPGKGHVNLHFNNTHLHERFKRLQSDLDKIPQWAFDGMLTLSSKFPAKLKKAEVKCAEMNKTDNGKLKYYPITPERVFKVNDDLNISTKDISIAKGLKHRPFSKEVIDFFLVE